MFLEVPSWRNVISLFSVGDLEFFGIQKLKLIWEVDSCLGKPFPCLLAVKEIYVCTYIFFFFFFFGLAWSTRLEKLKTSGEAAAFFIFPEYHKTHFRKTEIMPISVFLLYIYLPFGLHLMGNGGWSSASLITFLRYQWVSIDFPGRMSRFIWGHHWWKWLLSL